MLDFFVHISPYFSFLFYKDNCKIEKYFSIKIDYQKSKPILGKGEGLSGKNAQSMRLTLLFHSIFKARDCQSKMNFQSLKEDI